jgi:hypothetical protein
LKLDRRVSATCTSADRYAGVEQESAVHSQASGCNQRRRVAAVGVRPDEAWRIDPETDAVTRIPMPYLPSGVAADDDAVWVTVRA